MATKQQQIEQLEKLLGDLYDHVIRNTCFHESTHRGGAIWEICDDCGEKWADDRGGKPEFKLPKSVQAAKDYIDDLTAKADHLVHEAVENDCEDQGFTRIDQGCFNWKCFTWEQGAGKPTRPKLVQQRHYGVWFWVCPKCDGYYGEAGK